MSKHTTKLLTIKTELHPRNKHRERYDFARLAEVNPALTAFIKPNTYGDISIDFANPIAVKALNKALLKYFYQINDWEIPLHYLCPPIPGRADYVHHLADLIRADVHQGASEYNRSNNPSHNTAISVLDIGVGANMVYPLIGHREYGWQFVGVDIDETALNNAKNIISNNALDKSISLRLQSNQNAIFKGVIKPSEAFTLTMCNPPFHASMAEAAAGTLRKLRGLNSQKKPITLNKVLNKTPKLNFGGQNAELYCEGGELTFLRRMILESRDFALQIIWFTTLVSKATHLPSLQQQLKAIHAAHVKIINMQQGQKQSRILAWTFLNNAERTQKLASSEMQNYINTA
jgi:23S rRNA (adenine1618-N6)-methyltransferase